EPVTGFTASDVTLGGTAGGTKTVAITNPSNDNKTFNIAVNGMTTDGTVVATIPAGAAFDSVGNPNAGSTTTDNSVSGNLSTTTTVPSSANTPTYGDAISFSAAVAAAGGGTPT